MRYANRGGNSELSERERAIRNRAAVMQTRNMQENRNNDAFNARYGARIDRAMNNMLQASKGNSSH